MNHIDMQVLGSSVEDCARVLGLEKGSIGNALFDGLPVIINGVEFRLCEIEQAPAIDGRWVKMTLREFHK